MTLLRPLAFIFALLVSTTAIFGAVSSASADMSAKDQAGIEKIIREYLVSNPEVLLEAMNALRAKQEMAKQAQQGA